MPGENHWPVASHWQTLPHNAWAESEFTTVVVIGTDCICSCKSNYHTITMAPFSDNMMTSHIWCCIFYSQYTPLFGPLNFVCSSLTIVLTSLFHLLVWPLLALSILISILVWPLLALSLLFSSPSLATPCPVPFIFYLSLATPYPVTLFSILVRPLLALSLLFSILVWPLLALSLLFHLLVWPLLALSLVFSCLYFVS